MPDTERIYLYGIGGHADVVSEIFEATGVSIAGVFDDDPVALKSFNGPSFPGFKLQGATALDDIRHPIVITIGDNRIRREIAEQVTSPFATGIHPSAMVSGSASVGPGTVIMHRAVVQVNTKIGRHAIINTAASIDHNCVIADFAHISPNATLCGSVTIGEGTQVGASATVIPNLSIGKWCTIGAGSVIIRNVPDYCTVVGNPGRIIGTHTPVESALDLAISTTVESGLRAIVYRVLLQAGRPTVDELHADTHLQRDLKFDSLELAELTVLIEAEFGVDVFADGLVATVREVVEKVQRQKERRE